MENLDFLLKMLDTVSVSGHEAALQENVLISTVTLLTGSVAMQRVMFIMKLILKRILPF